jgi:recombination protein RecT
VKKFTRVLATAINKNPKLLECTRPSLLAACMLAAQDSLLPDGKEGAIIPFKDQATWMPMIGGILKKLRNSGELQSITSQVVYKLDSFEYYVDENGEHIKHAPNFLSDRGAPYLVYALAKTKDGGVYVEIMTADDVEQVRQVSRSKDSGPWRDWPAEMWRKTAIRRLAKRLPMSTDLMDTITRDDELYELAPPEPEKLPAPKTSKRLAAAVAAQEPEVAPQGTPENIPI